MAYKALYRTYRPSNFDEVAGQKYIVRTLQNAVNQNKIAHAYLFCGPRGTGKTSIAKIFAKAVNCESEDHKPCMQCENCKAMAENNHPDIVEIDAASNNGVEEVRNLIEKVKYAPIKGKYKVYIIDEVHMMSTGAFNALLKTIEEPPAHVIFILATTEPHKVIPTIISRCQRFDFTKISPPEMVDHIKTILEKEKIKCEDEVMRIIAQLADGGMRDALSILDQCIAYAQNDIKVNHINEIYGITTIKEKLELFSYIYGKNANSLLDKVKTMIEKGIDMKRLTFDLIEILKDCVVFDYTKDETLLKVINQSEAELMQNKSIGERLSMIDTLMDSYDKYRFAANVSAYFEVCLLKLLDNNKQIVNISFDSIPYVEDKLSQEIQLNDNNMVSEETVNTHNNDVETVSIEKEENVSRETSHSEIEETVENTSKHVTEESFENLLAAEPLEKAIPDTANDIVTSSLEEIHTIEEELIESNQAEQQTPTMKSAHALDDEFVLRLLVGANKPEKQKDMEYFTVIERYTVELEWAKPANTLRNTEIMASAKDYLILAVDNQAEANDINERDSHNEFRDFTNVLLHTYKKIFAVPIEQKNRVIVLFKERMKTNTLPEPVEVKQVITDQSKEEKEKSEVEIVMDLFGEGNVIITEE